MYYIYSKQGVGFWRREKGGSKEEQHMYKEKEGRKRESEKEGKKQMKRQRQKDIDCN